MRHVIGALALLGLAAGLGGCGVVQDVQSVARELSKDSASGKDDIAPGSSLSLPPGYALRPPATGASAAGNDGTARRTQVILRTTEDGPATGPGRATRPGGRESGPTAGERELMTKSGVRSDTANVVRRTVDIEADRRDAGEKSFTDRVLKYDPKAKPANEDGTPARDATGDKPVIKRKGEF